MRKKLYLFTLVSMTSWFIISCANSTEEKTTNQEIVEKTNYEIKTDSCGGYWIVGLEHSGSYKQITSKIDELRGYLEKNGTDSTIIVADYFNDEALVAEDQLKSFAGFIVKDSIEAKALIAKNPKFKSHLVVKRNAYYVDAAFTNWEDLFKTTEPVYTAIIDKMTANQTKMAQNEGALEEYRKGSVRFIVQAD
jgi:hypothetical protein